MFIYKEEPYGTIERIKEFIEENGLSKEEFADLVGVTARSVSRWFSGTPIRKNNLVAISEKMGCDVEFLQCVQDYPTKNSRIKIKLSTLSIADRYLPMIQKIMRTTSQHFSYQIGFSGDSNTIRDTFVEGDIRYHYEALSPNNDGEMYYIFTFSDGKEVKKSEAETNDFVRDIMKFLSYQVINLGS